MTVGGTIIIITVIIIFCKNSFTELKARCMTVGAFHWFVSLAPLINTAWLQRHRIVETFCERNPGDNIQVALAQLWFLHALVWATLAWFELGVGGRFSWFQTLSFSRFRTLSQETVSNTFLRNTFKYSNKKHSPLVGFKHSHLVGFKHPPKKQG